MGFQTPITIKEALTSIFRREFVLPAIQRELVWKVDQIRRLFDSIMRGYPIGSFLFWRVRAEHAREYRFYDFVTHYDSRSPHNDPAGDAPNSDLIAVLDGQQRLTSLNIGFNGSHTSKLYRAWRSSKNAFPKRYLFLNLHSRPSENDDDMQYDFRFLTPDQSQERNATTFWFPVNKILDYRHSADLVDFVRSEDLTIEQEKTLHRLHSVTHSDPLIQYYEEREQDLHRVLSIFVRTNGGGTVLSYSDMLLSVATAQWDKYDAREEIHRFVDEINTVGHGFAFNKDFVLKACLMLSNLDTKFRVTNFNSTNMNRIQDAWEGIKKSVSRAVLFASSIGYDAGRLTSATSLLPVAYYLHQNEHQDGWLEHVSSQNDRDRVRQWLIRSLLKKGVWGSGLDTLLVGLRKVLQEASPSLLFPIDKLGVEMHYRGKDLAFDEADVEFLADLRYGDQRVYSVLFLLYPDLDIARNQFHVDHVFPRAVFTPAALMKAGVAADDVQWFIDKKDRLGNLQLLEGHQNVAKSAMLPAMWLRQSYNDLQRRQRYEDNHDLAGLPEEMVDFRAFYDRRREAMCGRLRSLLVSRTSQKTE